MAPLSTFDMDHHADYTLNNDSKTLDSSSITSRCSARKALHFDAEDEDEDHSTARLTDCESDFESESLSSAQTTRSSVSFSEQVEIVPVPHLNDMTDDEFYGTWWTPEEFGLIRQMISITLQLMERGHAFNDADDDFCPRGLECKLKRSTRRRQKRRERARASLLRAQEFQGLEDFADSEYLAEVYELNCQVSRDEARIQGHFDEIYQSF